MYVECLNPGRRRRAGRKVCCVHEAGDGRGEEGRGGSEGTEQTSKSIPLSLIPFQNPMHSSTITGVHFSPHLTQT